MVLPLEPVREWVLQFLVLRYFSPVMKRAGSFADHAGVVEVFFC